MFQASQQWSTMSSWELKTRLDRQLSRMNCQTFSTGLSSGARRQGEDGDVGGHVELARGVPPGLIHDHDGMGVRGDGARYLLEMERHGGAVAGRQDQARSLALLRADGAEDIGRAGALIVGCAGPGERDLVLLADTGFVLEPDLYPCTRGLAPRDVRHEGGELFLNSSTAYSSCA